MKLARTSCHCLRRYALHSNPVAWGTIIFCDDGTMYVCMSVLQVALGATKAELDITKTLIKMDVDELSGVR